MAKFSEYLTNSDFEKLLLFYEDTDFCTLAKGSKIRLCEIGVIQHCGFGVYSTTAFGEYLIEKSFDQNPKLPLLVGADKARGE